MTPSTITGVPVQRDAEGFFIDPGQWTEEMADEIARENGIEELTDRHWIVIRLGGSMRTLGKVSGVPINGGTMTLNTSTVSGNTSSYNGGGIFKPATASTTAVQWGTPGSGPGEFKLPYGVAVDGPRACLRRRYLQQPDREVHRRGRLPRDLGELRRRARPAPQAVRRCGRCPRACLRRRHV